jgi:hypothetical protein
MPAGLIPATQECGFANIIHLTLQSVARYFPGAPSRGIRLPGRPANENSLPGDESRRTGCWKIESVLRTRG